METSSPPSNLKPQWFQILLALADRDLHGYGVMSEVLERTDGRMRLWPGTLYGSLKRMTAQGLIEETEAPPDASADAVERKFYSITETGRRILADEARRLAEYVRVAKSKNVLDEAELA